MATLSQLEEIANVEGVSQYILIAPSGKTISQNMTKHLLISPMIKSCLTICKTIQDGQFRHLVFAQDDNRDLFLFPVGQYFLGITKEANYEADLIPTKVYNFLTDLIKK